MARRWGEHNLLRSRVRARGHGFVRAGWPDLRRRGATQRSARTYDVASYILAPMSTSRALSAPSSPSSGFGWARVSALVAALGLAGGLAVLGAPAAHAHDLLLSSSPEDGESLESAPEELVLSFNNEPLEQGAAVEITDAEGAVVAEGEPAYAGVDVVFDLPELGPGEYEVSWTVVSSDGHRISDDPTLSFAVEEDEGAEPVPEPTETAADEPTEAAPEPTGTATEPAEDIPAAGPAEGELAQDEGTSSGWRIAAVAAAAVGVIGLVAALAVRIRRQQRN